MRSDRALITSDRRLTGCHVVGAVIEDSPGKTREIPWSLPRRVETCRALRQELEDREQGALRAVIFYAQANSGRSAFTLCDNVRTVLKLDKAAFLVIEDQVSGQFEFEGEMPLRSGTEVYWNKGECAEPPIAPAQLLRVTASAPKRPYWPRASGDSLAVDLEIVIRGGGRGQGFGARAEVRKAVEDRAMEVAMAHFSDAEAMPRDVSKYSSYDLLWKHEGRDIYIEVKGTTGDGRGVIVTRGEVRFAQQHQNQCVMVIVSGIRLEETDEGPRGIGGTPRILWHWPEAGAELIPLAYTYSPAMKP